MRHAIIYICIGIGMLTACNDDNINESSIKYEPKVAVEGSIEIGDIARVTLTESASIMGSMDTLTLLNQVIKHAYVTLSDGTRSEVLSLFTNSDKVPPYEYRSYDIVGEAGKSYTLNIEVNNQSITAETYIPDPVPLENVWFVQSADNDTTGYIHIQFRNTTDHYYLISTKVVGDDKVFVPCLYGSIDKSAFKSGESVSMQINKGPRIYPKSNFDTFFKSPNNVQVKFSTQTKESYNFWTSYQNELINGQNPIFPAFSSLKSNINGGIGIWSGYGSYVYEIEF